MIGTILAFLAEHFEIVELVYDLITNKGCAKCDVIAALQKVAVETSDAAMRAELKP